MPTIKSTDETFEKLKKEHKNLYLDFWAPGAILAFKFLQF